MNTSTLHGSYFTSKSKFVSYPLIVKSLANDFKEKWKNRTVLIIINTNIYSNNWYNDNEDDTK